MREDIRENFVWAAVNETTDDLGRNIANFIVGKLACDESGKPHLLASKVLEKTNNTTITRFVNYSLGILWPDQSHADRLLLLVTDGASYIIKAGQALHVFLSKPYSSDLCCTCISPYS